MIQFENQYRIIKQTLLTLMFTDVLLHIINVPMSVFEGQKTKWHIHSKGTFIFSVRLQHIVDGGSTTTSRGLYNDG